MTDVALRSDDLESATGPSADAEGPGSVAEVVGASEAGSGPTLDTALGLSLAAIGFVLGARVLRDNSFLTHLTTGDLIRVTGSVPSEDPYSFTAPGEPWTVQSWLASLWYSVLGQLGGGTAIRLANGLVGAGLMAMIWRLSSRAEALLLRFAVCGVVAFIGATVWSPRPLMIGLACLAAVLLAVDGRLKPVLLIPVMWVWVNSHGSFPLAFVLIGASGLGAAIDTRALPHHHLRVGMWAFVGLVGGAINPLGLRLLWFPVELLSKREALEGVNEWKAPNFDSPFELAFLALVLSLVFAGRARVEWRVMLPALVFAVAGFLALRNIAVATLVFVPALTAPTSLWREGLAASERSIVSRAIAVTGVVGLALSATLVASTGALSLGRYPVEEIDWLDERDLIGNESARIVHPDTVGNYLHYRYGLDARVFIDDRFDFYPQPVLDDHLDLTFGGDFETIVDRWEATAVVWEADSLFAAWLRDSADWTVQMDDPDGWILATRS